MLVCCLLAACSHGPATPPPATAAASGPDLPAGFTRVEGEAYAFGLPDAVAYQEDAERVTDSGATVRRWRYPLTPEGISCVVVAGEQPDYRGSFPAAAIAAFGARPEEGSRVLVNQALTPPPAGTVAAVRQEQSFVLPVAGGTLSGRVYARQYLTRGRTLVSLNAAGPGDDAAACRLQAIVSSLVIISPDGSGPSGPSPEGPTP